MSVYSPLSEARRVMTICNACRYCEGYCAVFPAMALRRQLSDSDLAYLANLCHNCRSCFYACQYAPPHEFSLNVPKTMTELRMETYMAHTRPKLMSNAFRHSGLLPAAVTLASGICFLLTALLTVGKSALVSGHIGPGAFYRVLSYPYIVYPMSVLSIAALVLLAAGGWRFWHQIRPGRHSNIGVCRGLFRGLLDAATLKYLEGYGRGCSYPDDRFRLGRRRYHHCLFYGFLLCLAATAVAAAYQHVRHLPAPYPFLSIPVLLGTVGGLLLTAGSAGSLFLKCRMDREPYAARAVPMDVSFNILLLLTSVSGLLLLLLRETAAMGGLLILHLAAVVGLFVAMPFGKFVHGIYRSVALVKHAIEQKE